MDKDLQKMSIPVWKNKFGIKIRKGCMSCIYAKTATERKKTCNHPIEGEELKGVHLFPTHLCDHWAPQKIYTLAGGATTLAGTPFTYERVKSKEYIDFIRNNRQTLEEFDFETRRQIFKYNFPNSHIYMNGTD